MDKLELFTEKEKLDYYNLMEKEFVDVKKAQEEFIEKRLFWTPRKKAWYMLKEFGSIIKNSYNNYNISKDDSTPKKVRKLPKD